MFHCSMVLVKTYADNTERFHRQLESLCLLLSEWSGPLLPVTLLPCLP